MNSPRLFPVLGFAAMVASGIARAQADSTTVFNEIMYHPANPAEPEWIELHNLMAVNMDLSGWRISGGVDYAFPQGTVIPARGFLLVSGDPGATGYAGTLGPWSGNLANGGERLRLRNNSDRLMDELDYRDSGRWPVAPDGSGATLAKAHTSAASGEPESWIASAQTGGTPLGENFVAGSSLGPEIVHLAVDANWLYNESGADLGPDWALATYSDGSGGWQSGSGALGFENGPLEVPINTTLTNPESNPVTTYYFQTTFPFSGNPAATELRLNALVDDGAVIYLNGTEISRINMPDGPVDASTFAAAPVRNAAFTGDFPLPTAALVAGANVLSVEVHQAATIAPVVVLGGGGLALVEERGTMDTPNNLALGRPPFAKDVIGNGSFAPAHALPNLNNGTYGNASSWIGNSPGTFCGINLGATPVSLRSFAFGRSNVTSGDPCGGGVCTDRHLGLYTLQYTQTPNPNASTPAGDWITIGTLDYQGPGGTNFASPHARHRYNFNQVMATGLRLLVPEAGTAIDEFEIYAAPGDTGDTAPPVVLTPSGGYALSWDGNDGDHFDPAAPPGGAIVPDNLALASHGTVPFGSGQLGGIHLVAAVNDGFFGNSNSWIGAGAAGQYIGLRFGGLVEFDRIAWGRDNGNDATDACGGQCMDRSLGTYTLQITRVASPGTGTAETGNAGTGWETVGTFLYAFRDPTFTEYRRHEYGVALAGGGALSATGLRLKVSSSDIAIDEIEIYGPDAPDIVFGAVLGSRSVISPPEQTPVVISEISGSGDATFRIELRNDGNDSIELGGFRLTAAGGGGGGTHVLPPQSLAPGAFLVLDETVLGFRPAEGNRVFLLTPGGTSTRDAVVVRPIAQARSSAHGGRFLTPSAPTFGSANSFSLQEDIVINEIMYHMRADAPLIDNDEEWIELYNRGASTVDLGGWSLDGGIDFTFPVGTSIFPGAYLVVARDAAALAAKYPGIIAILIGNFSGSLGNGGDLVRLKDAGGNPADEVRYVDGGKWPGLADGGGSSMELRDPGADNANPGAWAASDESGKSAWQTITYRMVAGQTFGPTTWREFRFGLLDAGEVLVDDLSVLRDPDGAAQQLIQNGSFGSATKWRFLGTHRHSEVIDEPGNGGNKVLRLVATAGSDTRHNHLETTFVGNTALVDGQTYEVSFRARWIAGSNLLHSSAYYSRLARTTALERPALSGTPGAPNSRLEPNIGPTFSGLRHSPVLPAPNEAVQISVEVADPDGLGAVTLHASYNGAGSASFPMTDAGGGRFVASIPGRAAGSIVRFHVTAADGLGASASAPAAGPDSRALYQVADNQTTTLTAHKLRLIMLNTDRDFLLATPNVMSNERLGGTVIYNDTEVFYDVGARLRGSGAGRARDGDSYTGYNIGFPKDQRFRGVHGSLSVDRSGRLPAVRQQHEIFIKHMFTHAGMPGMYDDLVYFIAPRTVHTGTAELMLAGYGKVFTESQFENGDRGTVFNLDITYDPTTTVDGNPESLKPPVPFVHVGTDITSLGSDKEQYRGPYEIRTGEALDDYSGLIAFCQTMSLPTAQLALQIGNVMDVDEWLRYTALMTLCGIGDTFVSGGLPHNIRLYVPENGTKVTALPWDMDFVFSAGATSSMLTATGNLRRVINLPQNTRLYWGHVHDLARTTFTTAYMNDWLQHYGSVVGQNFTGSSGYIAQRGAFALTQLPANVPFAVTTGGGGDFSVDATEAILQGNGWIDIREFRLVGSDSPLAVTWTSGSNWRLHIPLVPGPNDITVQALDFQGNVLHTYASVITSTVTAPTPYEFLRVTELHYHPADPVGTELAASTDKNDFEFIELRNIGAEALAIGGVTFTGGITFTFAPGTILPPGAFVVVAAYTPAFEARYGSSLNVAGEYLPTRLNNAGENVELQDASGNIIQSFTYADTWYPATDGPGYSLAVVDESAPVAAWNSAAQWGISGTLHGTPGAPNGAFSTQFESWQHTHFTQAQIDAGTETDPLASPLNDGIPNLLRYALGLSPNAPVPPSLLPAVQVSAQGRFQITFRRPVNALDLEILPEASPNLSDWTLLPVQVGAPVPNGDGTETVTFQESSPSSFPARFGHLRVTRLPLP